MILTRTGPPSIRVPEELLVFRTLIFDVVPLVIGIIMQQRVLIYPVTSDSIVEADVLICVH